MKRLLLDVNVALDAVIERSPHSAPATRLWAAVEMGRVKGLLPAHGVVSLFHLFAKAKGVAIARRTVGQLLTVFEVAAVDQRVLHRALTLGWRDFEDAVCAAAAEAAGCDFIVTRDPAGFRNSPVPTVDPATALAILEREGPPNRVSERRPVRYAAKRAQQVARPPRRRRSAKRTAAGR